MSPNVYLRYRGFYERWGSLIQLVQGAIVVAISVVLLIIGLTVLAQSSEHAKERAKERATLHATCERARVFGPPLLSHLEGVEARLKLGALERDVEYPVGSHKMQRVLAFYRETIPKSCPSK